MRCGDCRHWEREPSWGQKAGSYPAHVGHCERWDEGYHIQPEELSDTDVLVEDDEGWGNIVGVNFGCVLFEAKEEV